MVKTGAISARGIEMVFQSRGVAIARALAGNPRIIMADEPTAALDSTSGHDAIDLLHRLAKEQGCTVLMVTHDPWIVDIADRVAYLEDGLLRGDKEDKEAFLPGNSLFPVLSTISTL